MTARIYVGTYAKYNNGSIAGAWLDLDNYPDKDSFLTACKELHKDESDPELMFQDFEGFPKSYYAESSVPDSLWDWLALDDDDKELLEVYQDAIEEDAGIDRARDAAMGRFNSESDWAADWLEQTGALESIPENLRYYFDYEAYARDAQINGDVVFARHGGEVWVFFNR